MTLKDILLDAISVLEKNRIVDAEYDAKEILLNMLDMDMSSYLFECDTELTDRYSRDSIRDIISEYNELINARASHFPLQYILGETYFCGLRFLVNSDVLIPRQDTETLVERVLEDNGDKNKYVLDMCTGSGCIAIALANLGGYKFVVGTDISDEALEVAEKNAESLVDTGSYEDEMEQHIYFLKSDLFDRMDKISDKLGIDKFDIITINPPYVKSSDIKKLQDEVKKYEPRIALDGDKDGLRYYREIAKKAKDYLSEDGKIYLEIGYDQASDVKKIFENEHYNFIDLVKDMGGNDRVLIFSYG